MSPPPCLRENESRETAVKWVEIDRKVFARKERKNSLYSTEGRFGGHNTVTDNVS